MKENKIEKLILDLSNRWECTPQEAVDRLNSMNESEINKLINSMTKKFQGGGKTEEVKTIFGDGSPIRAWVSKGFFSGNPTIRLQKYTPRQKFIGVEYADNDAGFLERTIDGNDTTYVGHGAVPLMLVGEQKVKTTSKNQNDPMLPKLRKAFNVLGYKNGGFIDCLRDGGSVEKCKCGCDKIAKADEGKKLRIDRPGYAYTMPNGIDVLTQDAVGLQPAPGSYSAVKGSSPEFETQRRRRTDKGGNVKYDLYKVFVNDGDHYGPVARYTTKRTLWDPRTWFATLLEEQRAKEMQTAYDVNNLKCGGPIEKAALGTQIGGKISKVARSTMFDDAKEFMPEADRQFVRQAYRAAKNHGRDLGLTGRSLRNWSKNQVSDRFREYADKSPVNMPVQTPQLPVLDTDIVIEDEPIVINDNPFTNLDSSMPTVQKIDRFGGNFNSAFAAARRSGLGEFEWNGKRYNTRLAPAAPLGKAQPVVNKIMTGEGDPAATKRSESAAVWYPGRPSK